MLSFCGEAQIFWAVEQGLNPITGIALPFLWFANEDSLHHIM